jgi:hypothetical protein
MPFGLKISFPTLLPAEIRFISGGPFVGNEIRYSLILKFIEGIIYHLISTSTK